MTMTAKTIGRGLNVALVHSGDQDHYKWIVLYCCHNGDKAIRLDGSEAILDLRDACNEALGEEVKP